MSLVRRLRLVIVPLGAVLLGGLLLAACSGSGSTAAGPPSAGPPSVLTTTAGTITAPPTTITSTAAGATLTATAPPPTSEPAPVDSDCPYLATDAVADINGQHTGTTQIIDVQPQPICMFYRSDGGWMATIRVIQADTPQAAVAAVDQHVPIDGSNPANQPPGWTGGSMVTDKGSVYAVSKGTTAIVAESNQRQSIKGRQMVIQAVTNLGL